MPPNDSNPYNITSESGRRLKPQAKIMRIRSNFQRLLLRYLVCLLLSFVDFFVHSECASRRPPSSVWKPIKDLGLRSVASQPSSEMGTTSLQWTRVLPLMCLLFGDFTAVNNHYVVYKPQCGNIIILRCTMCAYKCGWLWQQPMLNALFQASYKPL